MKKTIVKKGKHYSNINFPRLWIDPKSISRRIWLNPSLSYCPCKLPAQDAFDINKLFGVTWGLNSRVLSARFGFSVELNDKIKLHSFTHQYDEQKWDTHYLTTLDCKSKNPVILTIVPDYKNNSIAFYIDARKFFTQYFDFSKAAWLAVELDLYHGGNNVSPQDMSYEFERLNHKEWLKFKHDQENYYK